MILKIELRNYRLTETNLENLASEFYGKICSALNSDDWTLEFEFPDEQHKMEFERALRCFEIDFGQEKS